MRFRCEKLRNGCRGLLFLEFKLVSQPEGLSSWAVFQSDAPIKERVWIGLSVAEHAYRVGGWVLYLLGETCIHLRLLSIASPGLLSQLLTKLVAGI